MEAVLWIIGILVTINLAVVSFIASRLWAHVVECHNDRAIFAFIKADVERMKQDIGTHDTGIRGACHHLAQEAQNHEGRIYTLEHRSKRR